MKAWAIIILYGLALVLAIAAAFGLPILAAAWLISLFF